LHSITSDKQDAQDEGCAAQDAACWHWQGAQAASSSAGCHRSVRALVWAYSLSLRNLEAMMAERGIEVDHSSVHRWVIKLVPLFEKAFRRHKRPVGKSWRMDETFVG